METETPRTILVTGGAGFIGSALVRRLIRETHHRVVNLDALTYAGNLASLEEVLDNGKKHPRYHFEKVDLRERSAVAGVFAKHPDITAVMHLAAESHVDRSIEHPEQFITTNVLGTYNLLDAARRHMKTLSSDKQETFRFLHVSTDEVYGSLGPEGLFQETSPYQPNSPYSASKAASDHLARAWGHTYDLPVLVTNCSNNYGPYQFPEKLIPLMIRRAIADRPLPVYGTGDNVRDWLYVDDHVRALCTVLERGRVGETYNIGGNQEQTNLNVVKIICRLLDEARPSFAPHGRLIAFVADRPGHDKRYAIDITKIHKELGWSPQDTFESGLRKTVQWYLDHAAWCETIESGSYRQERLGLERSL